MKHLTFVFIAAVVFVCSPNFAQAQSDPVGFDRVVNFPAGDKLGPDSGTSLGNSMERTQFNFNDGSIFLGPLSTAGSNNEINIYDANTNPRFFPLGSVTITDGNTLNVLGGFVEVVVSSGGSANINADLSGNASASVVIQRGGIANLNSGIIFPTVESGGVFSMNGGLAQIRAESGSTVRINAGRFDYFFSSLPGSSVSLTGGNFRLNGQDYAGTSVSLSRQDVFTGTTREGRVFILAPSEFDTPIASLSLNRIDIPDGSESQQVYNRAGRLGTVGVGQVLNLGVGQVLDLSSGGVYAADLTGVGATVNFEGGEVISERADPLFRFSESQINVRAGMTPAMTLFNSEVNIFGGQVGEITSSLGSIVNVTGGTLRLHERAARSGIVIKDESTMNISGGIVDFDSRVSYPGLLIQVELGSVLNISGGNFGGEGSISEITEAGILVGVGGSVNISGGSFDFKFDGEPVPFFPAMLMGSGNRLVATEGSQLNLIGTEFFLDGELLEDLNVEQPFIITERDIILSGTLLDGSQFSFDLSNPAFDISEAATLAVTLSAIPEPSSLALILSAFLGLCLRRTRFKHVH